VRTRNILLVMALIASGCRDKNQPSADEIKHAQDSMAAARKRGEVDLSNPEMGAKVLVTLTEYKVESTHLEIPKGQVTIAVENKGKLPHEFQVKGISGDFKSMPIPAGGTVLMSMVLDPGDYDMFATGKDSAGVPEKDRGMKAKILVR
jgi:hypothetical protein